jgi:hypothetical protein
MCETPNYSATTPDQDCFNRLRRHRIIFSSSANRRPRCGEGICRPITRRRSARPHARSNPARVRAARGDRALEDTVTTSRSVAALYVLNVTI